MKSAFAALVFVVLFTSCGETDHADHDHHDGHDHAEKPLVVVPVPPYTGLVKRIAGDAVEIETLVGVGKDPHFFSPTPRQVARVNQAAVYFTVGMPFEVDLIASLKKSAPNLKVIDLTKGIELLEISCDHDHDHDHGDHEGRDHGDHEGHDHGDHEGHDHGDHEGHDHGDHEGHDHGDHEGHDHGDHEGHDHGDHEGHDHGDHEGHDHGDHEGHDHGDHEGHDHGDHEGHNHAPGESDPHIWLSPELLMNQVKIFHAVLEDVTDQGHSGAVHKNAEALEAEITLLDYDLAMKLKPLKGQSFYVYHGAFGYLAESYGLTQESIQLGGKSPEPKRLTEIIAKAKAENVKMIFVQPQFDQTAAKAIAEAIGGTVLSIDPLKEDVIGNLRSIADAIVDSK